MWTFTKVGFFSIVQDTTKPGVLLVRARDKQHLDTLRKKYMPELSRPTFSKDRDYPWRARAPHQAVTDGIARAVMDIDYSNFKEAVGYSLGKRFCEVLHKVWWASTTIELDPLRFTNWMFGEDAVRGNTRSDQQVRLHKPEVKNGTTNQTK